KRGTVMRKARSPGGAGESCHPLAARASMQVDAKRRPMSTDSAPRGRKDLDCGVSFKNRRKPTFDRYADVQIGTEAFEQLERGCCKNAVTERAQANDGHMGAFRQLLQDGHLRLDGGLIF